MARSNTEFGIDRGPSKLDLMLSLFDTDMGKRTVTFHTPEWIPNLDAYEFTVQIVSARRRNSAATIWEIEGIIELQGEKKRVSICYLSDTSEGRMRIEDNFQTKGIMETPDGNRKARALMIVIQKMMARYQNRHSGDLDEDIFKLFEKAKVVNWAEDHESLVRAIENV